MSGRKVEYSADDDNKFSVYQNVFEKLKTFYSKNKLKSKWDCDIEDIYFVCRDMSDQKSVITNKNCPSMLLFIWDLGLPVSGKNLILLTKNEYNQFNKLRQNGGFEEWLAENKDVMGKIQEFIEKCKVNYDHAFPAFTNLSKNLVTKADV